jgi:hypothetical protein
MHSVERFNFLTYLSYIPYKIMKFFGSEFKWKRMEPYYQALTNIK